MGALIDFGADLYDRTTIFAKLAEAFYPPLIGLEGLEALNDSPFLMKVLEILGFDDDCEEMERSVSGVATLIGIVIALFLLLVVYIIKRYIQANFF